MWHGAWVVNSGRGRGLRTRTARFRWPLWVAWLTVGTVVVFGVVATRLNDDSVCDPVGPELGALHDPGPELQVPMPPRWYPLVTWTGREIVVFGGQDSRGGLPRRPCDDGAAYDPRTQRWRAITAPGFDPPLLDPSGIWLGSALVVVGEPCDDQSGPDDDTEFCKPGGMAVGVYEPDLDTWRIVPPPHPLADGVGGFVVGQRDGAAVVAVGGGDELWLLDPATEHWSPVPSPPLTGRFCADNENIIAIGDQPRPVSPDQDPSASATDDTARAAPASPPTHLWSATLPAGRNDWTQPAPIPEPPVCAAGTAYIPAPTPLQLDPVNNTLVPMPQPPIGVGTPTVTTADDLVVFWPDDRSAVSFTPSTQQWRITTHQNGRRPDVAIWIGGQQFLLINEESPGDTADLRLETLDL
jgi:Kelch motif